MDRIPGIRRFFRLPASEDTVRREIDDEVGFHLESRVEALVRAGSTPEQARAQALREFGDVSDARGELSTLGRARVRRERRSAATGNVWYDVKLAVRGLLREPGFTAAVVVTLGLGLGLNGAMFSITDRLLFRAPAHVWQPDQVKRLYFAQTRGPAGVDRGRQSAYPEYRALADGVRAFSHAAAYFSTEASLGRGQEAERVSWTLATASFFPTLGVQPHIGRFYTDAEDVPGNAETVIVLSHDYWRRRFGGEVSALGRVLEVNGQSYTVIGVAPRGFSGVDLDPVDLFVPISAGVPGILGNTWHTTTTNNLSWLRIIVRLRPDVLPEQVTAEAINIMREVVPAWRNDSNATVTAESIILARAPKDWGNALPDTARIAFWLSGVSMLVLLIACANVTNLLLSRLARRRREVAIRLALGVTRMRLVGQFVLETALLAGAGALAGLGLAHVGGNVVRTQLLGELDWSAGALDARVLGFTGLLVAACSLITALAPAFQSLSTQLISTLKSGARATGGGARTRAAIVVGQTALCVLLLAGSGFFVKSLHNLNTMPRGFDADRVIMLSWNSSLLDPDGLRGDALYRAAAERVRGLPAVENAAVAMSAPFWSSIAGDVRAEGVDSLPRVRDGGPYYNGVTPEYFATMGTRIVRGRGFTEQDGRPGSPAAIVSATMARLVWPGQNPLGKCLYVGREQNPPCTPVVGVAENALRDALEGDVLQYYLPLDQLRPGTMRTLFVRTRGDPVLAVSQIRQAVQEVQSGLPAPSMSFVEERMRPLTRPWRLGATLFTAFGALAVLLAAIGLYGVIAYNVTQRAQEIGVRLALGARRAHVFGLVLRDAARMVAAGLVLGTAAALAAGTRMQTLLFHVSARDPIIFAAVAGLVLMLAGAAVLLPARRAARASPMLALKTE